MKNIFKAIALLFSMMVNLNLYSQLMAPKFSIGILSSDIHESEIDRESERRRNVDNNESKIGFYTSVGSGIKLFNWFNLEFGISYQERLPLEKFTFYNSSNLPGMTETFSFAGYPTSQQSKFWDKNLYLRFPNFKYAHFELIPTFSLGNTNLKIEFGLGVFYGYLLNHKKLQFSKEDFPNHEILFGQIFNINGIDSYNKHDVGWLPKFSISYKLSNKCLLGVSFKSYVSQYGLKKEREYSIFENRWNRQLNTTWMVYTIGMDFTYDL